MGTDRIHIYDTTLPDGEQSPGASMNTEEKVTIRVRAGISTRRGAHSDIIVASAKAYTNAHNRLLVAEKREVADEVQGR
ncbi:MAG: alpha-isopropylmalate synthase regulatory domain-containing protein [Coriobacteriia bacterium]|nr:alpha-isopropylmalate synthase regulatory domain-containing protein [Coriobacteriia bacterium]